MIQKIYYKLTFSQTAPLRISNGDDENTDSDLMLDSRGMPFIPGSSIAGVLRTFVPLCEGDELLGYIGKDGKVQRESSVLISNAVLPDNCEKSEIHISHRDGVGINERGTALDNAKYDFEVVETAIPYTSILEWSGDTESAPDARQLTVLTGIMDRIAADGISFGARTSRGYGSMSVMIQKREFDFGKQETDKETAGSEGVLEEWLAFDPFSQKNWWEPYSGQVSKTAENCDGTGLIIEAECKMTGSFAVRRYTECLPEEKEAPSSVPLKSASGAPVIPGTSWAGAFRHHMLELARQASCSPDILDDINSLFGVVSGNKEKLKSSLYFSETAVEGGKPYTITRNALDRFTAAPVSQALYTSEWWQGGTGKLIIRCRKQLKPLLRQLLAISIIDLNLGLLTAGGSGGTGHGCVEILSLKVNHQEKTQALNRMDTTFLEVEA